MNDAPTPTPSLTTAVVGAGPAGLLFSIVGRILVERQGSPAAWALRLYDKRTEYVRTHRLRMDPAPYREIQKDLVDPRFDRIIELLDEHDFAPEVNLLEARLSEVLDELGVRKQQRTIGDGPGEVSLAALRRSLEDEGCLASGGPLTIVAADSVHSATREMVRGPVVTRRHTHERLARLRVVGDGLPKKLGLVDQIRLSKVLGSIVDYRLNRNGFAEIDLFLTEREHHAVHSLGATPGAPVPIASSSLSRLHAPLFRAIVQHLESGLAGPRQVLLYSTFQLEHALMPRLVFERPDLGAHVFLLGDAGISLPFFRGMACLARCAHSLAHVHADRVALLGGAAKVDDAQSFVASKLPVLVGARPLPGQIVEARATVHRGVASTVLLHRWVGRYGVHVVRRDEDGSLRSLRSVAPVMRSTALSELDAQVNVERRYEREAAAIVRREVSVVGTRARLIRATRELARLSALLPFPIQSWLLRAKDLERAPDHASPLLLANVVLAASAAALALSVSAALLPAWLAALSFGIEIVGGAAFHASVSLEHGPHRWVRRVWQAQIAGLFVGGFAIVGASWPTIGVADAVVAGSWWLVLAAAFVMGLYGFEAASRRALSRAELEDD